MMVGTYKKALGSRTYANYSNEKLAQAIQQVKSNEMSLRKASKEYRIPLGTLSNKLRNKHTGSFGHPTMFNEEEENSFVEHIQVVGKWGFPLSLFDIRAMAQSYLNSVGRVVKVFNNNLPSNSWAKKFLKGDRIKANKAKVSQYQALPSQSEL